MSKAKSRKKKVFMIVTVSVFSLILCTGIGGLIWYQNSPFPTAVKMMSAVKDRDVETVLACIEPDQSNKIRLIMGFTGISPEDLLDKILSSQADKGNKLGDTPVEKSSVKFAGYERNGDRACLSMTTASGEIVTTYSITFVRISGTWYLSLG